MSSPLPPTSTAKARISALKSLVGNDIPMEDGAKYAMSLPPTEETSQEEFEARFYETMFKREKRIKARSGE